ncbi:hypothetical protein Tco_0427005, partial [Tanacetum coccineum]
MAPTTRGGPNTPINNTNPHTMNLKAAQAVVGLTRWIEKMESVFNIN